MLTSGEMVGKYKVVRSLGTGGMGAVYLGWDEDLKREVAIKIMNPKVQGVENALRRFCAEAQSIARLSNAHIVHVYDFDPKAAMPYIVMEYVRGVSLADTIQHRAPLPIGLVVDCARQTLQGLAAAHKAGIIHRDIKPANILLSDENVVKIMDFGLARSLDVESGLTADGAVVGTVHYLAPEVARGEAADTQSDLYSLGVTLYEMLSGTVPFDDESPLKVISRIVRENPQPIRVLRDDIPVAIATWLHKMLAKDLGRRYSQATDALADIAKIDSGAIPREDPLRNSDGASTAELPLTPPPGASDAPAPQEDAPPRAESGATPEAETGAAPGAAGSVTPDEVDAIMSEALRIEKAGRDALDEEALLEIAAEVGVDADAVRAAVAARRRVKAERDRRQRIAKIAVPATAALLAAGLALWLWLRRPPHETREYAGTGGQTGAVDPKNAPPAKAETLAIGPDWTDADLAYAAGEQTLLVRVVEGKEVEARVGKQPPFTITGGYYGAPAASGPVAFRAAGGSATVAAACVKRLRLAALPFSAGRDADAAGNFAVGTGDTVSTRLGQRTCFDVITRVHVEEALENIKLENTEYFDPTTAARIGHLVGVDYLVTGSVQQVGSRYRMSAKRLEAETGKVLENAVVDGTDPFALQDRLAASLISRIQATELSRFLPARE